MPPRNSERGDIDIIGGDIPVALYVINDHGVLRRGLV